MVHGAARCPIHRHATTFLASLLLIACGSGQTDAVTADERPAAAKALPSAEAGAGTQAAAAPAQSFIYSAGYRLGGRNVVELGILSPCGTGWCLDYGRYDGAANLQRVATTHRHAMRAPFRSPACIDALITTVNPGEAGRTQADARIGDKRLSMTFGPIAYEWSADPAVAGAYLLSGMARVNEAGGDGPIDQAVGFAFSTAMPFLGPVSPAQIVARFNGEIHHKNADMGVADDWLHQQSSLDLRRFTQSADGFVLMLTEPGHPDVVRRTGKPLWAQNSMVLARGNEPLAPLVQEYGHDFDMDGCFDESGHNKLLLPVVDEAGSVRAMAYIEYSPDNKDGVPMLSVGRYYR